MSHADLIRDLKSQSTWRLLGLGIVTYGVYYAHYCATQSQVINRHLGDKPHIPAGLVATFIILSYVSLGLLLGYLLVDKHHPIAILSNVADKLWIVLLLIWGFMVRNRINSLNSITPEDPRWFHGFWTFLFTPLYFNYKVNVLNERE